jgi:predicted RND superfamily exporter protein
VWQLALVTCFGFELDPYSILVPFLVFAIGVSHGAQKMNGIMQGHQSRREAGGPRASPSAACSWRA